MPLLHESGEIQNVSKKTCRKNSQAVNGTDALQKYLGKEAVRRLEEPNA